MLAYIRVTGNMINETLWTCNTLAVACSFLLCIYWSNMNLRTFKRISNLALGVLSALLLVFVAQAVRICFYNNLQIYTLVTGVDGQGKK